MCKTMNMSYLSDEHLLIIISTLVIAHLAMSNITEIPSFQLLWRSDAVGY